MKYAILIVMALILGVYLVSGVKANTEGKTLGNRAAQSQFSQVE